MYAADEYFVFIVGSQKSGTTWVRDCFRHFISIGSSEWYFPLLASNISSHIDRYGSSLANGDRTEITKRAVFAAWNEIKRTQSGDKSAYPNAPQEYLRPDVYPYAIRMAREFIPSSKTVVVIRDPRAVFHSLSMYLDHFRPGWSHELDAADFAKNWVMNNRQWISDRPDSIIRYEDMKADFVPVLIKTLKEVDISCSLEKARDVYEKEFDISLNRHRQPEIYRSGTVAEWRSVLSEIQIQQIEHSAGEFMLEYGYSYH